MKQPAPIYRGHVPFARFLMALSAGIAGSYLYAPSPLIYSIVGGLFVGSLVTFVGLAWWTKMRQQRYYAVMGVTVFVALFAWGFRSAWQTHPDIDPQHFSRATHQVFLGTVADEPVVRDRYIRFPLKVTHAYDRTGRGDVTGTFMVTVAFESGEHPPLIGYGDELLVPATYQRVPPPYNPGEMDYQQYLSNHHIWHQGYFSGNQIQKVGAGKGNPLMSDALRIRKALVTKFGRYVADRDALAVASTLILGYRADLSDELLQAFSSTGTIHVLSVSGMHVVIVFWLFSKLIGWMDRSRSLRWIKFVLFIAAVWGYAGLTGFSPSVLRASVMISFVIGASAFHQENRVLNSIAASAFFLLLYEPKFIADIGFQLSYLAVLGIMLLAPLSKAMVVSKQRFLQPVGSYVWMSISAQAGAGPLATYYFHQFPVYFLVANLFIALPASGIMYLGFALLVLPEGGLAAWVGRLLEKLIVFVNTALYHIEQLPMATLRGIWISAWDNFLIYVLLFSGAWALIYRSKPWCYGAFAALLLWGCTSFIEGMNGERPDELIIFNVKQDVAIGMIRNGEAWVYSNLASLDDRTLQYAVLPGLERKVPADRIHWVPSDRGFYEGPVYVNDPVIQFGDTRILVCDGRDSPGYARQLDVDALDVDVLLVRNNPRVPLAKLLQNIRCRQLVLDGSNHRFTIDRLTAEARAGHLPLYVLKNNFAWTRTLSD